MTPNVRSSLESVHRILAVALAAVLVVALAYALLGPIAGALDGEQGDAANETNGNPAGGPGATTPEQPTDGSVPGESGASAPNRTGEGFRLVGHDPLLDEHQYVGNEPLGIPRGSNGDVTAAGDCVYVGSLVGYQPPLIVDVSDPSDPAVVGPVPDAIPGVGNGIEGIAANGDVLVVQHREPLGGASLDVPEGLPERGFSVWDISEGCRQPELVARYDQGDRDVHALRLWRDPVDPDRMLAVQTAVDGGSDVAVVDLTGCPEACDPTVVAEWDLETQAGIGSASHEAVMSADGERIYVAQPDVGYLVLDSSSLLSALRGDGDCDPAPPEETPGDGHCLATLHPDPEEALSVQPEIRDGWQHTLLPVPDRPYVLATGETGGPEVDPDTGEATLGDCPGAAIRLARTDGGGAGAEPERGANATDGPGRLAFVGRFALPVQREADCSAERWKPGTADYPAWPSPHFPLAFPDVVFATYYGEGLRAIDVSDPADPVEVGRFVNDPVEEVRWASYSAPGETVYRDDGRPLRRPPAGPTHPFAFSYPITHEGYVVYADVQSGLYVLEYHGPHAGQVPDDGNCLGANPGGVEPGFGPCPPYGEAD